jgi:hypothetical protein
MGRSWIFVIDFAALLALGALALGAFFAVMNSVLGRPSRAKPAKNKK